MCELPGSNVLGIHLMSEILTPQSVTRADKKNGNGGGGGVDCGMDRNTRFPDHEKDIALKWLHLGRYRRCILHYITIRYELHIIDVQFIISIIPFSSCSETFQY